MKTRQALQFPILGKRTWPLGSRTVLFLFVMVGCGAGRHELYQRLPDEDKELFARSKQFMTDNQQEQFLELEDSPARAELVQELHIQDRLIKFPAYVQEAILAGKVVSGMTTEAVLLAWGRPLEIERRQAEDGAANECWTYNRPDRDGQITEKRVFFLSGQVTEVLP